MHLKHRPETLDEVFGNGPLKKQLDLYIKAREFLPIMFEGIRGCGKTTFAMILANEFNIPKQNITHLNCVHFSKIEDMRERLQSLSRSSLFGKEKVLILDEIHELSSKTQQVLLVPLEDENFLKNTLVIACTTTTKKVIPTLVDRFVRFQVRPLGEKDSIKLIGKVAEEEGFSCRVDIGEVLLKKAEGNPRRLLTGLIKLQGITTVEEASYLLDLDILEDDADVLQLFKIILANKDWNQARAELAKLLKTYKSDSIRISLMNIIAGRLTSNYMKGEQEGKRLVKMYDVLSEMKDYPERSNISVALYKIRDIWSD